MKVLKTKEFKGEEVSISRSARKNTPYTVIEGENCYFNDDAAKLIDNAVTVTFRQVQYDEDADGNKRAEPMIRWEFVSAISYDKVLAAKKFNVQSKKLDLHARALESFDATTLTGKDLVAL